MLSKYQRKRLKSQIAFNDIFRRELRDVTCHNGITQCYLLLGCYPTQVNAPRLNFSPQAGTRFTYPGGWKAQLTWWLVTYRDGVAYLPAYSHP